MLYQQTRQAYQSIIGEGATQASLIQLVYHHLAQDLFNAAKAVREHDIEARCLASNHALLLLGHLESWVGLLGGDPVLEESLTSFYSMLRVSILQAQGQHDGELLDRAAHWVLDTRSAWQVQEGKAMLSANGIEQPRAKMESVSFCA